MRDSYHVYLKVGPHRHANNTQKTEYITFLEEADLEKSLNIYIFNIFFLPKYLIYLNFSNNKLSIYY